MTPRDDSEPPVRKTDIFREQALQAWRGQEAETRVLLDLSPGWMRWALGGILVLATLGILLAASISIPKRAASTAMARLSSHGDTLLVDAVFTVPEKAALRPGQAMSFRSQDPRAIPIDLAITTIAPYKSGATDAATRARVFVQAAIPTSSVHGDPRAFTGLAASGTAHVLIGNETLLHLFRPRTPVGAKS